MRGLVNLLGALEGRERNRRGKRVVAMIKCVSKKSMSYQEHAVQVKR
jgi:hypothetical protein